MNEVIEFIKERGRKLEILQDDEEEIDEYLARVVYSVVGVMASACLWNNGDYDAELEYEETTRRTIFNAQGKCAGVSVVYWKRFVKRLYYAYCASCPLLEEHFPGDREKLIRSVYNDTIEFPKGEIEDETDVMERPKGGSWTDLLDETLDLYERTGAYYSLPFYVAPARRLSVPFGEKIFLARGLPPGSVSHTTYFASGLGIWSRVSDPWTSFELGFQSALGLQKRSFADYYRELRDRLDSEGKRAKFPEDSHFLRTNYYYKEYWGQYWIDNPNATNDISLGRYGNKGQERYFLYRKDGDGFKLLHLKEYETNPEFNRPKFGSREYIRIATAILAHNKTLPPIRVETGRTTVDVKLGYLLPPAECSFFKLYSWPLKGFASVGQNFDRRMTKEVYEPFKAYLTGLGHAIEESDRKPR